MRMQRFWHLFRLRSLSGALLGLFSAVMLAGCGSPQVNEAAVSPARLAAYHSPDLLVLRSMTPAVAVPAADFIAQSGPLKTPAMFQGHWTLFYVGYSFCPDICPTELTALAELMPMLKKALPAVQWQVVFLSVDPERDNPKRLAEYAHYFDPSFIGMTGSRAAIDSVTGALKAGYRISPHAPGDVTYEIDHDTGYRLISPDGKMVALLPSPHDPAAMTQALVQFFKEVVQ